MKKTSLESLFRLFYRLTRERTPYTKISTVLRAGLVINVVARLSAVIVLANA